jgi:hypothetical protein
LGMVLGKTPCARTVVVLEVIELLLPVVDVVEVCWADAKKIMTIAKMIAKRRSESAANLEMAVFISFVDV